MSGDVLAEAVEGVELLSEHVGHLDFARAFVSLRQNLVEGEDSQLLIGGQVDLVVWCDGQAGQRRRCPVRTPRAVAGSLGGLC